MTEIQHVWVTEPTPEIAIDAQLQSWEEQERDREARSCIFGYNDGPTMEEDEMAEIRANSAESEWRGEDVEEEEQSESEDSSSSSADETWSSDQNYDPDFESALDVVEGGQIALAVSRL